MSYMDRFLAKNPDIPKRPTDKNYKPCTQKPGEPHPEALREPTKPSSVSFVAKSQEESPDFTTNADDRTVLAQIASLNLVGTSLAALIESGRRHNEEVSKRK